MRLNKAVIRILGDLIIRNVLKTNWKIGQLWYFNTLSRTFKEVKAVFSVLTALLFLCLSFYAYSAFAAPNYQINYQGKLTDNVGVPVSNGTYEMEFNLYTEASGGVPVWTEQLDGADEVLVQNGLFSVMLGSTSPLTGVDFDQTLYLGVTIESDNEMEPRKILGAVPAAFFAARAESADTVGGVASTSLLRNDAPGMAQELITFAGGASTTELSVSGTLAIGTSSPSEVLSVVGNGFIDGDLITTGNVSFRAFGAGVATFDASGNLLASTTLGDNVISDTLTIGAGSTLANGVITPNAVLASGQNDEYCLTYESSGSTWEWQDCGGGSISLGDLSDVDTSDAIDGSVLVYTPGGWFATTSLYIATSTGSVAIGNTNPQAALDIFDTDGESHLRLSSQVTGAYLTMNNTSLMMHRQSGSNSLFTFITDAVTDIWGSNTTAGAIQFNPGGSTPELTILRTGQVGIGTTTPTASLTISPSTFPIPQNTPVLLLGTSTLANPGSAGTYIAINAPSAFNGSAHAGKFIDFQRGGVSQFMVSAAGYVTAAGRFQSGIFSGNTGSSVTFQNGGFTNLTSGPTAIILDGNSGQQNVTINNTGRDILSYNGNGGGFGPNAGTGGWNHMEMTGIRIAQRGTASGVTRLLYLNPDRIISAADFRALETSAYTYNLLTSLDDTSGVLFNAYSVASSGAVTVTTASELQITGAPVAASGATIGTSTALLINGGSVAGGGSVTNAYGLQVFAPTGATNNYAATFLGGTTSISALSVTGNFYDNGGTAGASGYVLQSTGTGVAWVATSSLGITGGSNLSFGSESQIPFMNSGGTDFDYSNDFTFDGSLLAINGGIFAQASSTIGDGTAKGGLTVWGSATTTRNMYVVGTTTVGRLLSATGGLSAPALGFSADLDTGINYSSSNGGQLEFIINGAEKAFIQSNGIFTFDRMWTGNGVEAFPGFTFSNDDGNGMYLPAADTLGFSSAGVERLRLTSTGNVGIGTKTPTSLLTISNSVSTAPNTPLFSIASTTAGTATTTLFTVLHTGNVGIGTTTPNFGDWAAGRTLSISNFVGAAESVIELIGGWGTSPDSTVGRIAFFQQGWDTGPASIQGYRDDNNGDIGLRFATNDIDRMVITGNDEGYVGIGTTSPYAKLSVAGHVVGQYFTATSSATSTFPTLYIPGRFYDSNGTAGASGFVLQSTGSGIEWVATSSLGFAGAVSEATVEGYIFDSDAANVAGVWEVQDDVAFQFGSDANWSIEYDEGTDDQLLFVTTGTAAAATTDPMVEFLVGGTPTADQQVFGVAKGTQGSNTALFTIDEDGDVVTAGTFSAGSTVSLGNSQAIRWDSSAYASIIGTSGPSGYLSFLTNGSTEVLRMGSSVISTSLPFTTSVAGSGSSIVRTLNINRNLSSGNPTAGFGGGIAFGLETPASPTTEDVAGAIDVFWTDVSNNVEDADMTFSLYLNGTLEEKLRITSGGNLGIATSTPGYALTVDGDVMLSGALFDNTYSSGISGYVLQSTGTGVEWVATSSLGITGGSNLSFGSEGQIPFMNSGGTDFDYSNDFTFDGSILAINGGIFAQASSTIGGGTAKTGLTIAGNATTTGSMRVGSLLGVGINPLTALTVSESGATFVDADYGTIYHGLIVGNSITNADNVNTVLLGSGANGNWPVVRLKSTSNDKGYLEIGTPGGSIVDLTLAAAGPNDPNIKLKTDGVDRLTILSSGEVGIGTTTPTATLTIAGAAGQASSTPLLSLASSTSLVGGAYASISGRGFTDLRGRAIDPEFIAEERGTSPGTTLSGISDVFVAGNYAYVTNNGRNSLAVIDISDPANPIFLAEERGPVPDTSFSLPSSVFVAGNYAYVTNIFGDSLVVVDISNPTDPVFIAEEFGPTPGTSLQFAERVFVSGNYAYVVTSFRNSLAVIDISNPTDPVFVAEERGPVPGTSLEGAIGVRVAGKYAYVTSFTRDSIAVIDISDPTDPVFIAEERGPVAGTSLNGANGIFVSGDYAYVTSQSNDSLAVIDISNPADPVFIAEEFGPTPGTSLDFAEKVFVSGNYAYVTSSGNESLAIVDVGGAKLSNFAAGTGRIDNLLVDSFAQFKQSAEVAGGLNVGGNALVSGALTITGNASTTVAATNNFTALSVTKGNVAIGSSTPLAKLSVQASAGQAMPLFLLASETGSNFLSVASGGFGTTTVSGLAINGQATTTSNVGFNITDGCYAVDGVCISGGGGATTLDALTDVDTSGVAGGNILSYVNGSWVDTSTSTFLMESELNTSSELAGLLSDETGTGLAVFATNPLLTGFRSNASSTIGDGTQAGGLTISGGATTTGNAYYSGHVGIGIAPSDVTLEVADNDYSIMRLRELSTGSLVELSTGFGSHYITGYGEYPLAFSTNASERMRIDVTGNIGIGTSSPYAKLSVAGHVVGQYFTATSTATSTFPTLAISGPLYAGSNAGTSGYVLQTTGSGVQWVATTSLGFASAGSAHDAVTLTGEDFLSLSGQQITAAAINPDNLANADFGDFSCNGTTCSFDDDVITAAKMADSDHGFFSYSGNVASLDTGGLTSANLISALTDETGSGSLVFNTNPVFDGKVGIGTTTPRAPLSIEEFYGSPSSLLFAGVDQNYEFTMSGGGTHIGESMFITNAPTSSANTMIGSFIRIEDNTLLANVVRGLEVQAHLGTNTAGEHTAISGFGRTFGVRAVTEGDAGSLYEPAGLFAQTRGTTQGNALRAYSNSITSATLFSLLHEDSTFTGTGLLMDFASTTGGFSGDFLDLRTSGTSRFSVTSSGTTTVGNILAVNGGVSYFSGSVGIGTTTPMSTLSVQGSLCVRNTGTCGTTAGTIYATNASISDIDLAENYRTEDHTLEAGEIVSLDTQATSTIKRARRGEPILGVISTKPGLLLGQDIADGKPVALKGRIPMKVNMEGGEISVGDALTLSNVDGVGQKASSSAPMVAIALEAATTSSMIEVFIQNGTHFSDSARLAMSALTALTGENDPTLTEAEQGAVSTFFNNLSKRMITWLANAENGITTIIAKTIKAITFESKEICLTDNSGKTCIDRAQLNALLENASDPAPNNNPSTPPTDPEPEPQPEPEPETEPEPELEPEPEEQTQPEPEPETEPEQESEPEVEISEDEGSGEETG